MKRDVFKKILRYLRPQWPLVALVMLCACAAVAGQLCAPYFIGRAIDAAVGEGAVDFSSSYRLYVAIAVSAGTAAVAQIFVSALNNRIAYGVLAAVRKDAFARLTRLPLSYFDAKPFGETSSALLEDAEQFADGLLLGFTQLFTGGATIVGVLVVMFIKRWEIALCVVLVTPLSLFAARFIASRTYAMFREQTLARAEQTAFIDEMVGSIKTVKAFVHEEENEAAFSALNEDLRKKSLRAVFFSSTTNPVTRFVNSVVYALVALVGALLAIRTAGAVDPFTVGDLSTFLFYSTQYTKPFNEISEVLAEFQNALACAGRVFAVAEEEEEPSDDALPFLRFECGEVEMKDVDFSYSPERELIKHLSIRAGAGKRIAIVGPTGCGKTTLINLLMRFYDVDGGSVEVDGQDIRTVTRRSLRMRYGMVLQETWLKHATVRENLCMGAPFRTEEEMIEAAKAAHAHNFILRLPQGYDTVVGGEGSLSEGQRQLLCIARVMLCRPPMLILDEATSSIDTRTELLVQDAFARLMKGRTCFVVAHRLSTIQNADCILVMREGKIVEQGTHEQLLSAGGFYAELYEAQFAHEENDADET